MPVIVRYEQAIYGSFPFWDKGYAPLAASAGCLPSWLDAFHAACRAIGEKPKTCGDLREMMFCLRVEKNGPWMIVGVSSPGSDDRGRPGALAFHALFVEGREFHKVGYDPFALSGALASDWDESTTLSAESLTITPTPVETGARSIAISSALARGRKVAIASETPIFDLARQVWHRLPVRLRKKRSVATWAFSNGPRFDLVAAPSHAGWDLEGPYRDPFGEESSALARKWRKVSWLQIGVLSTIAVALIVFATVPFWWPDPDAAVVSPAPPTTGGDPFDQVLSYSTASPPRRERDPVTGPDRNAYPDNPNDTAEIPAVLARLEALAKTQLRVPDFSLVGDADQPEMERYINAIGNFRYTGPLLTKEELAEVGREGAGRSRALLWDAMIRRFVADRWPSGLRNAGEVPADVIRWQISAFGEKADMQHTLAISPGPLRWQIDVLAWSFHVEPDPKLTTIEQVDALADALKLDEPTSANPLKLKYPTLIEYSKFLDRLPVR